MSIRTALTQRLGIAYPIIQAPLAGGGDTPALVAAVSDAGGLGFIGAAYLTPEQIGEAARKVRAQTSRPFGINLFAPVPVPDAPEDPQPALERVAPYFAELGLPPPAMPERAQNSFNEQLVPALESGASVFSFTLGMLPKRVIETIKGRGMFLIGTATTVEEAIALEEAGVDAIVTQGSEAGGHRATFGADFDAGLVGTISLVPQVFDAVTVPVIASGGIMDGRGIAESAAAHWRPVIRSHGQDRCPQPIVVVGIGPRADCKVRPHRGNGRAAIPKAATTAISSSWASFKVKEPDRRGAGLHRSLRLLSHG